MNLSVPASYGMNQTTSRQGYNIYATNDRIFLSVSPSQIQSFSSLNII